MHRRRALVRHARVGSPHALNSLLEPRALLEIALLPAAAKALRRVAVAPAPTPGRIAPARRVGA